MQIHNEEISRFNLWFNVGYAVDKVQEILGCGKQYLKMNALSSFYAKFYHVLVERNSPGCTFLATPTCSMTCAFHFCQVHRTSPLGRTSKTQVGYWVIWWCHWEKALKVYYSGIGRMQGEDSQLSLPFSDGSMENVYLPKRTAVCILESSGSSLTKEHL